MAPSHSLFNNEYSRGPLYQYWKERGVEEKALRTQRIQDAQLRSKGHQPLTPTFGPSSNDSYAHRATSGPPTYDAETTPPVPVRVPVPVPVVSDQLPSYSAATGLDVDGDTDAGLLSSDEEKARLRQLEEQTDDAAIAAALSRDETQPQPQPQPQPQSRHEDQIDGEVEGEGDSKRKGKQPERRKSAVAKIGGWFADAASGYTKNQGRW